MLKQFTQYLEVGGLPLLFLLVLLEGNPIVGSFIPGQILVIMVGFLISMADFANVYITVFIVFLGALIGDMIGYFMGRKLGLKGLKKFGLSEDQVVLKSSKSFFKKYGVFALILGRQLNPTRAFMPFLAGCMKMQRVKFFIVAVISSAIWSSLSIYLGYYFGSFIVDNFAFFAEFFIAIVIYVLIVFFTYKQFMFFTVKNKDIVKKYALNNVLFLGVMSAVIIWFVFLLRWDYRIIVNDYFAWFFFNGFYLVFAWLFSPLFIGIIVLVVLGLFLYKKKYAMSTTYLWSLIFLMVYNYIISIIFDKLFGVNIFNTIIYLAFVCFYLWTFINISFPKVCSSNKFYEFIKSKKRLKDVLKKGKKYDEDYKENQKHDENLNDGCVISNCFISKFIIKLVFSLIIIVIILASFSKTGDFFMTVFSFMLGVIFCELMLVLSGCRILDINLSKSQHE